MKMYLDCGEHLGDYCSKCGVSFRSTLFHALLCSLGARGNDPNHCPKATIREKYSKKKRCNIKVKVYEHHFPWDRVFVSFNQIERHSHAVDV